MENIDFDKFGVEGKAVVEKPGGGFFLDVPAFFGSPEISTVMRRAQIVALLTKQPVQFVFNDQSYIATYNEAGTALAPEELKSQFNNTRGVIVSLQKRIEASQQELEQIKALARAAYGPNIEQIFED